MGKRLLKRSYDGALDWDTMRQMFGPRLDIVRTTIGYYSVWTTIGPLFGLRLNICSDYHWILFCSDYDWTFVWTTIEICSDYAMRHLFVQR